VVIKLLNLWQSLRILGWEVWSFTSREEHRLRVNEKRVLKRIFGSTRKKFLGGCRKPNKE
jgi:hypothetical protein